MQKCLESHAASVETCVRNDRYACSARPLPVFITVVTRQLNGIFRMSLYMDPHNKLRQHTDIVRTFADVADVVAVAVGFLAIISTLPCAFIQ